MAVIKTGPIVADIRGSISDVTFARNQGGLYTRHRAGPTDPPTPDQLKTTATLIFLSRYWSTDLTAQQRSDWRAYAAQHPRPDRWGIPRLTSGYNRFIAHNARLHRITGVVYAPHAPSTPPLSAPQLSIAEALATGWVTIDLTLPAYRPPTETCAVQAYFGRPVSPGVNFYAYPWSYAGVNMLRTPDFWAVDPWVLIHPDALPVGNKLWMRFNIQGLETRPVSIYHQTSIVITSPPE